jgi:3-oxoacyl-[acyl-carrier-protein] synthase II
VSRRVVVTGIGVCSPIGSGFPAFAEGLRSARHGIDEIRSFDASSFPTRIAGEVRDLDPDLAELPPDLRPALARDRKSLFGLFAGREALASAFGASRPFGSYDPRRVGAHIAAGLEIFHLGDLTPHLLLGSEGTLAPSPGGALPIDGPGLAAALASEPPCSWLQIPADLGARAIVREAGARGGLSVNLSACAAGTQALGEALLAIVEGELDAAIAGGYDSMVNPLGVGGFCLLEALSTSNHLRGAASRPFDARRDGFVLGEGAALFVLEEASCAERRGARVLAELLGYGSTADAFRVTDPAPEGRGAQGAMRAALAMAGLGPEEIDYVNAHGTGTRKNDPVETAALHAVFGPAAPRIPVSSTKSQIGHLIGASGAVELAATIFALEAQLLPATLNLDEPDPECDLDYVPREPRPAKVAIAMSNSFGFGGQNASLVVARPGVRP